MREDTRGRRIRVTLERVQILDIKEPFFDRVGEVRLRARVSTRDHGGMTVETLAPPEGVLKVSATPGRNFIELDLPIFEGPVEEHLEVELTAVEVDPLGGDAFQPYRRVHLGEGGGLVGRFGPGDERLDTEELADWRVWYRIEEV
jgi:hypothetical protein